MGCGGAFRHIAHHSPSPFHSIRGGMTPSPKRWGLSPSSAHHLWWGQARELASKAPKGTDTARESAKVLAGSAKGSGRASVEVVTTSRVKGTGPRCTEGTEVFWVLVLGHKSAVSLPSFGLRGGWGFFLSRKIAPIGTINGFPSFCASGFWKDRQKGSLKTTNSEAVTPRGVSNSLSNEGRGRARCMDLAFPLLL